VRLRSLGEHVMEGMDARLREAEACEPDANGILFDMALFHAGPATGDAPRVLLGFGLQRTNLTAQVWCNRWCFSKPSCAPAPLRSA
jgi:hypothetical protein